eukprot:2132227-Amphidinium_carterae.1
MDESILVLDMSTTLHCFHSHTWSPKSLRGAIPEGDADEELSKHPQFQHLVDTLQKHQQMLYECSQQQQEVVNALMGVPEIADALKTFPFFLGTDSAE